MKHQFGYCDKPLHIWIVFVISINLLFGLIPSSMLTTSYQSGANNNPISGQETASPTENGFTQPSLLVSDSNALPLPTTLPQNEPLSTAPANFNKIPLSFEPNQGQIDPEVRFSGRARGYNVFFTANETVLSLHSAHPSDFGQKGYTPQPEPQPQAASNQDSSSDVLRMKLVQSNQNPTISGLEELASKSNYFRGSDPNLWQTDIPRYNAVKYSAVYPNIDMIFKSTDRQLEYNFNVAPGGDPANIQLSFEGANKIELNEEGELILHTSSGLVTQHPPTIYQEIEGVKKTIKGHFVLKASEIENQIPLVGFQIGEYDANYALIIDPVIAYASYLGGSDGDVNYDLAVDGDGNMYLVGASYSVNDFPTKNAVQTTNKGYTDVFVAKINPNITSTESLVYATYLGGWNFDYGRSIALDKDGNVYITGNTKSHNKFGTALAFPLTMGSFPYTTDHSDPCGDQTGNTAGYSNDCTAFVTKLGPVGNQLVYSRLLGHNLSGYSTRGYGIAVDSSGQAYVTGYTNYSAFPTTANAFQKTKYQSEGDKPRVAFVTKLSPDGVTILYSTFIGGSGDGGASEGYGIAVDNAEKVYVTGYTSYSDFPTKNGYKNSPSGLYNNDAFLVKLDTNPITATRSLLYATLMGGTKEDFGFSVAVDRVGNAYVTGRTNSGDLPIVNGFNTQAIFPQYDPFDGFVCKIDTTKILTDSLVYSSYLGGQGSAIAVDGLQNIYVAGATKVSNFRTIGSVRPDLVPDVNTAYSFAIKINPFLTTTNTLVFSTLLHRAAYSLDYNNNSALSYPMGIASNGSGCDCEVYVASGTGEDNLPTADGYQPNRNLGGSLSVYDAVAVKIDLTKARSQNLLQTQSKDLKVSNYEDLQDIIRLGVFSEWDKDDLFSKSSMHVNYFGTENFKFPINRYYGLVNNGGPNKNKLIDFNCTTTDCSDGTSAQKRNRKLHAIKASLYLWVVIRPNTSSYIDPSQITIVINNKILSKSDVSFNVVQATKGLLKIDFPFNDLMFPDVCVPNGGKGDSNNYPYCLRNETLRNFTLDPVGDPIPEPPDSFPAIKSVTNSIAISGLPPELENRIACPYLFLNGIRPVMLMAGLDTESPSQVRDTTPGSWGKPDQGTWDRYPVSLKPSNPQNNWIYWLSSDGIPNWNPGRNGSETIDKQQKYLKGGAEFLRSKYGAKKINIIGHSMGGITSRQFVYDSNIMQTTPVMVDKLITLASPHTGVRAAGIAQMFFLCNISFIGVCLGEANIDLGITQMYSFNKEKPLLKAWSKEDPKQHLFFTSQHALFPQNPADQKNYLNDDGLIEDISALGQSYPVLYPGDQDRNTPDALPGNWATSLVPAPDDCNHVKTPYVDIGKLAYLENPPHCHGWVLYNPNRKTWIQGKLGIPGVNGIVFDYNKNAIAGTPPLLRVNNESITPFSANNPTNYPVTLLANTGLITSNSSITIPLTVDSASDASIKVSASVEDNIQIRLETNSGMIIAPSQPISSAILITGTQLAPGNYNLILTSGILTSNVEYKAIVNAQSDLWTSTELTPPTAGLPGSGKITFTLGKGDSYIPIVGANVTATLYIIQSETNYTTTSVTLLDNGTNGDTAAGDGIYTVVLPSNLMSETIVVGVYASGSVSGTNFTRFDLGYTKARNGKLKFSNNYNWQTISKGIVGANSDIDKINFNLGVNVQESGNYRIIASLVTTAGIGVSSASTNVTLTPGTNTVQLSFNGFQLWQQEGEGPYHIASLKAYLDTGTDLIETDGVNDNIGIPQLSINRTQLHHDPFVQNGNFTDQGIDLNGGKFQNLQVTLPLYVGTTATYAYSGILKASDGTVVADLGTTTNLTAGTTSNLVLKFDGGTIAASGKDGPYELTDLVLENVNSGQVLYYAQSAGFTNVYQASQFTARTASAITPREGTPQITIGGLPFENRLRATVKTSAGDPVGGVNVTFTAPSSEASGTFAGGGSIITIPTDSTGTASSPIFTANNSVGVYTVTASVGGVGTVANFNLTNAAGDLTLLVGTAQTTAVNTAFPTALQVQVLDANSNPVSGTPITFSAPISGASGNFAGGGRTVTVNTNATGVATAPTFTANNTVGNYIVTAETLGVTALKFNLTNTLFGQPVTTTVTSNPNQMVTGDFNGDGNLDLIVSEVISNVAAGNAMNLLLGNGNETFQPEVHITAAGGVSVMAAGDFNKDGKTDLVTDNYSTKNRVKVWLNTSTGNNVSFATPQDYLTSDDGTTFVAVGDVNGDGNLDIVTVNNAGGTYSISVLRGNGDGTFAAATNYSYGTSVKFFSVFLGDLTGDAKPELILGSSISITPNIFESQSGPVLVMLNNGDGTFAAPLIRGGGPSSPASASRYIVVKDFNKDGKADIAIGNNLPTDPTTDAMTIQLGNGDGTFSNPIVYPVAKTVRAIASADFTCDGNFDIALANYGGSLELRSGSASGTFQEAVHQTVNGSAINLLFGDFNNDGKPDLVTANYEQGTISFLPNRIANCGAPSNIPTNLASTNGTPQSTAVNTAFPTTLKAYVSNVNGDPVSGITVTFTAPNSGASGVFSGGNTTVTAATNASGVAIAPIFTANGTTGTYTLTATVSGVITSARFNLTNTVPSAVPSSIVVLSGTPMSAYVNGTFSDTLKVKVLDGNNNPMPGINVTFTAPTTNASVNFGASNTLIATTDDYGVASSLAFEANALAGSYNVTATVSGVITPAIFNLTNLPRIATQVQLVSGTPQNAASNTAFPLLLRATVLDSGNNPVSGETVTFTAPASGSSGTFGGNRIITANSGADGVAIAPPFTANGISGTYVVTATISGVANIVSYTLTNTNIISASFAGPFNYRAARNPKAVVAGDFNGDGKLDLAVANNSSSNVSVLLGSGNGGFGNPINFPLSGNSGSIATGDFDGDGKLDLVTTAGFLKNSSSGGSLSFQAATTLTLGSAVAVADFDGDSKLDIATINPDNRTLIILKGNGNGTFGAASNYTVSYEFDSNLQALVVGDFNEDGKPDVAVVENSIEPSRNSATVLLNNGNGSFATATRNSVALYPKGLAIKDVNGDGHLDLVTVSISGNKITILLGNGNGTFQSAVYYTTGTLPSSVAVADLNGDGKPDLITTNQTDESVSVLLGKPTNTFDPPITLALKADSQSLGLFPTAVIVADVNADNKLDIVTVNAGSEMLSVFTNSYTATALPPATITVKAGTPQTGVVNTAFSTNFKVLVKDSANNPVSGVSVSFSAPGSGASGTFAGGTITTSVNTDANGVAIAPNFTANALTGAYTVNASVNGVATPTQFSLTNTAVPASVAATAGTPQSTMANSAFSTNLQVTVRDASSNPVSGVVVTFTAPSSGASGIFAGGTTIVTASTNASGIATAPIFTANAITGTCTVTATVSGVATPAQFNLTNTAANLLADPSFELNTVWNYDTPEYSVVSNDARTGTNALKLESAAPTYSKFARQTVSVQPNTVYTFSFWAKGQKMPLVDIVDPNNWGNLVKRVATASSANYTKYSVVFNSGSYSQLIVVVKDNAGSGITYFDDFELLPGGTLPPATANVVNDPSFENGNGWTYPTPPFSIGSGEGHSGSKALKLEGNAAWSLASQDLKVQPNTAYSLSFWLKGQKAPYVDLKTSSWADFQRITTTLNTNYTYYGLNFNSGANSDLVLVIFDSQGNGIGYLDDVALVPTASIIPNSLTATAGTPQSSAVSSAFSTNLQATVFDANSNPVSGVSVSFTAPGSGASGTFSGGGITATASTNASGIATAPTFTANTITGTYTVTATVSGVATPANFSLTNTAAPIVPTSITATAGTPQNTVISTVFSTAFQATVRDASSNPVSGVVVTFTAPGSGASGVFSGGSITATATTNVSGVATAPTFTANTTSGVYTITATVSGVATPANFSLTNLVGAASSIIATAGTPQSRAIGAAFTTNLQATVKDSGNNLLSGVVVTFTAPGSGASGTFTGGTITATATSNASGIATAPTFTANNTTGTYTVTASVVGVTTPANFSLTNTVGGASVVSATAGTPQSATIGTAFTTNLQATVKDSGNNPVSSVIVTFAAPSSGASGVFSGGSITATATTNASGVATAPNFTANTTSGVYTITATVSGVATPANFSLTNLTGAAATITVNAGNAQSTAISTSFTTQLKALVKDSGNNPVSGLTVTFTAPASGASGSFTGGVLTATATTNVSGIATAPPFTANTTPGTYTVTASVGGVATPAQFNLTNISGTASSLAATTGTPQSATVNTAFSTALQATVKDSGNNPVSGNVVIFTAPSSGASGIFSGGNITATATTNASGIATAPTFTANAITGTYTVTATVSGVATPANFSLTNTAAVSGGQFLTAVNYGMGTAPKGVATADFNRDGILDLVTANSASNNLSIRFGNADGTFQTPVTYTTGTTPKAVAVGDLNFDAIPDLIVANIGSNNFSVRLGNSDGTFQTPVTYTVGTNPSAIALGDLDGYANPDVVTANSGSNNVSTRLVNSDGTFQANTNYAAGTSPVAVVLGDFNNDNKLDLITANTGSANISERLNNGNGTFAANTNYSVGVSPTALTVGDFNKDGKLDLAVANGGSNNVSVRLGNGDGTFQTPVTYTVGTTPSAIAVGDFNRDGILDLAVAGSGSNAVSLLLGNSNGTFQTATSYAVGSSPSAITVGDFNRDGKPDLAVANIGTNNLSILINNFGVSSATLQAAVNYSVGTTPLAVTSQDLNYDGVLDLVTVNSGSNNLTVRLGNSNGTFQTPVTYTTGTTPKGVALADLNFDGIVDLVVANSGSNNVSRRLGNADGTFQTNTNYAVGTNPVGVVLADLNNDGNQDLLTVNSGSNNVSRRLGNGDGTFAANTNYPVGTTPTALLVGDFNRDGKLDLAVTNSGSNNVSVRLGNGDGTFQAVVNYAVGSSPNAMVLGDFNRDGILDLAVTNSISNSVSVLLGNSNGTFQTAVNYTVGTNPGAVAVGDFNRDGIVDLVVAGSDSNTVSLLPGNSNGTFQTGSSYSVGTTPKGLLIGDFNRDGKLDIVIANSASNNVSVLLSQ